MHAIPFDPTHLRGLTLQSSQSSIAGQLVDPAYGEFLRTGGDAISVVDEHETLLCGGVIEMWDGRSIVWALISAHVTARRFLGLFRVMRDFLASQTVERLEACVDTDFEQGHRMMRMLGFTREGTMRAYQDGRDCDLYARVR